MQCFQSALALGPFEPRSLFFFFSFLSFPSRSPTVPLLLIPPFPICHSSLLSVSVLCRVLRGFVLSLIRLDTKHHLSFPFFPSFPTTWLLLLLLPLDSPPPVVPPPFSFFFFHGHCNHPRSLPTPARAAGPRSTAQCPCPLAGPLPGFPSFHFHSSKSPCATASSRPWSPHAFAARVADTPFIQTIYTVAALVPSHFAGKRLSDPIAFAREP